MKKNEEFTDNFVFYIRDFIDCIFLMYNQVNYCAGYDAVKPGIDLDDLRKFQIYFLDNGEQIAPFLDLNCEFKQPLSKRSLFNGSYMDSRFSLIVYGSVIDFAEESVKLIELSNPVSLFELDKEADYIDGFTGKFRADGLKLFHYDGDILDKSELEKFFVEELGLGKIKRLEKFVCFENR